MHLNDLLHIFISITYQQTFSLAPLVQGCVVGAVASCLHLFALNAAFAAEYL